MNGVEVLAWRRPLTSGWTMQRLATIARAALVPGGVITLLVYARLLNLGTWSVAFGLGLEHAVLACLFGSLALVAYVQTHATQDSRSVPLLGTSMVGFLLSLAGMVISMAAQTDTGAKLREATDIALWLDFEIAAVVAAGMVATALHRPVGLVRLNIVKTVLFIGGAVAAGLFAIAWMVAWSQVLDIVDDALRLTKAWSVVAGTCGLGGAALLLPVTKRMRVVRPPGGLATVTALALSAAGSLALATVMSIPAVGWHLGHGLYVASAAVLFVGQLRILSGSMARETLRIRELVLMQAAARDLARSLDLPTIRRSVVRHAAAVLAVHDMHDVRVRLARLTEDRLAVVADSAQAATHDSRVIALDRHPELVVATGHTGPTVLAADPFAEEFGPTRVMLSMAAIPVAVDGRREGLLCVSCDSGHRFEPGELHSLVALADLAGMAFAKAWAHRDETDLVARLQTLASRAPDIVAAPTLSAALAAVLRTACELTGSAGAEIALLTEDGLHLDLHAAAGPDGDVAARIVVDPPVLIADPAPGGVRRPFLLADPIADDGPLGRACRRSGVRSLAAVPVVHRGVMLGTLYAVDKRDELEPGYHSSDYSADDVVTLETLAVVAGAAVQGLRLLKRLDDSALMDPLTGLPNCRAYQRMVSKRPMGEYSILAIDVDNLKAINDEGGHEAGDAVLRTVGEALRSSVRACDVAARIGGDEFVVIVEGSSATAEALSRRIQRFLYGSPVPHGRARVSVGAAVGHAGGPIAETRSVAEAMLLQAKAAGGDRTVWPVPGGTIAPTMTSWEDTIEAALAPGGLRTVFQPIVRISDGCLMGMEALSRPSDLPAHASVEELFAAAQHLGRMRDLDWACRRQAVHTASRLPRGVPLFLNVSAGALCDPMHAVDQMQLLLDHGSLRPRDVVLEITERERVSDVARLAEVVAEYRAVGFRFAVDDLGDGHGSIATLVAISPEFQKLAKAMLSRGDSAVSAGVAALVGFAGQTSGDVIAEGVEDAADLEWAAARGIGLAQGYGICRPVEVERAAELIRRGRLDLIGGRPQSPHRGARPLAWSTELAWPAHVARRSRAARS